MKKLLAGLLAASVIFTAGCQQTQDARFRIVTSFYPVYIMALNVTQGVDGVVVENMAGQQTGCLHDYQLQSRDMKNLEMADVFIINGAGMESFMDDVTAQLPELEVIDSSYGMELLESFNGDEHDHDHDHDAVNPHVWVSITNYIQQVQTMADSLALADPEHAEAYLRNAQEYISQLSALRDEMHSALDSLPNKDIITFHEAFPYFAQEFGLNVVRVISREPDSQPSAKELAETIEAIRKTDVKAVFVEPQYPDSAADAVAAEAGVKVYTLDPGVTGEDHPRAYLDAMEKNLDVLKEALA